jgi:D-serine deaminase-like pyridoxal phosphate-dependent protein
VASKSLRVPALVQRALASDRVEGVLAFHVGEAEQLVSHGIDDVFIAYPPAPEDVAPTVALASAARRLWATVDAAAAVDALGREAERQGVVLDVALDVDLSWRKGPVHLGVRRSPVRSAADALEVAAAVGRWSSLRLSAVLAYEAQVAGVQDRTGSLQDAAVAVVKARSRRLALERRREVVEALRGAGHPVEVVNGGGTGSVHSTGQDPVVTEVSAGSGLFCPHLFDGYAGLDLEPAAFFALSVVRASDPGFVTCYGGGFVASGASGTDRLPVPWWPEGLGVVGMEGFGEVQTPFIVPRGRSLGWGDTVLCRHAKAGELMEHVDRVLLVEDDVVVDEVPTLRGERS